MRKKLMLLSALTCLSGGWALLKPADAQSRYPSCEALVGTQCFSGGPLRCTTQYGRTEYLTCYVVWQWSPNSDNA